MSITFSDLIQIYRESEPLIGSEKRLFCIQTEQQLNILNQLLSDDNYENTVLESENTLELGAKVNLIFGTPKPQFGRFFNKLDDFIKGDITQFNNDALSNAPYFIKS